MLLGLGLVQFLQLAAKEQKCLAKMMWMMTMLALQRRGMSQLPSTMMLQPPSSKTKNNDVGASVAIGVRTTMAILPTPTPASVTIIWMMLTNDENDAAHKGNDGQDISFAAVDGDDNDNDRKDDNGGKNGARKMREGTRGKAIFGGQ